MRFLVSNHIAHHVGKRWVGLVLDAVVERLKEVFPGVLGTRVRAHHPDVVVTDVQMPGSMDGIKLVHYIRNRWPPAALFIVSAQKLANDSLLPDRTIFYGKPLDSRRLVRDLNAALDA